MVRVNWKHLVYFTLICIDGLQLGIIRNTSLVMNCENATMDAFTCTECLCNLFNSTQNLSVLSLNCHRNSSTNVRCELFAATAYARSCLYRMENNSASTFYFRKLPSYDQSITQTTETTQSTTRAMTTARPVFIVRSQWNGFILDLQGGGLTQRTRIIAAPMRTTTHKNSTQLWYLDSDRSIRSVPAGLVIDIDGGINSINLHLYHRYAAHNQEFIFNNSFIICPYSNAAMTIDSMNTTTGVYVTSRPLNYNILQRWDILLS